MKLFAVAAAAGSCKTLTFFSRQILLTLFYSQRVHLCKSIAVIRWTLFFNKTYRVWDFSCLTEKNSRQ